MVGALEKGGKKSVGLGGERGKKTRQGKQHSGVKNLAA